MTRKKYDNVKGYILWRDNSTCQYCNERGTSIDHINAKSRGGDNSKENLMIACVSCNRLRNVMNPMLYYRFVRRFGKPYHKWRHDTNHYALVAITMMENSNPKDYERHAINRFGEKLLSRYKNMKKNGYQIISKKEHYFPIITVQRKEYFKKYNLTAKNN